MNERIANVLTLMRESAAKALAYAVAHPNWADDELVLDAIAKRVEQVAELAKYRIPRAARGQITEIPWDAIAGMRDRLVHDYTNIDVEVLRAVLAEDLDNLIGTIDRVLARREADK